MDTSFNIGYLLEMLLPVVGICIVLNKKKHPLIKGVACVGLGLLFDVVMTSVLKMQGFSGTDYADVTPSTYIFVLFWFMSIWIAVIVGIYLACDVSLHEAIYLFAVSYGIEHIFYCIRELVDYRTNGMIADNQPILYTICLIGSFCMAYFWFAKRAVNNGKYLIETLSATTATVIILVVVWWMSIIASFNNIGYIHAIYAILACLFILVNQRAQLINENEKQEFRLKEQLWKDTQVRYQFSKDAMAVVNQQRWI